MEKVGNMEFLRLLVAQEARCEQMQAQRDEFFNVLIWVKNNIESEVIKKIIERVIEGETLKEVQESENGK